MKNRIPIFTQRKTTEMWLSLPSLGWLSLFFTIPILVLLTLSFKEATFEGNLLPGFTLSSFRVLLDKGTLAITWRTIWLASSATLISVLISIPLAYTLARMPKKISQAILLLIFIPSWSCFLVRIFAWKTLLHPDGFLKHLLVATGICPESCSLLYNNYASLFVMIYSYAPFALLPLFNAALKFNFQLLDAAYDLGASRFTALIKIFLPNIMPACRTAAMLVLIPAAGAYIIPDLVGGTDGEMLGNRIAQKIFFERNIPEACVLSLLLATVIFILGRSISKKKATSHYAPNQMQFDRRR